MPTLRLILKGLMEKGPKSDSPGNLPALAWDGNQTPAPEDDYDIVVRAPFHRVFFAKGRLLHEVEHKLAKQGNEMHVGHTFHFCGRAGHAFRFYPTKCLVYAAPWVAEALVRDGHADVQGGPLRG